MQFFCLKLRFRILIIILRLRILLLLLCHLRLQQHSFGNEPLWPLHNRPEIVHLLEWRFQLVGPQVAAVDETFLELAYVVCFGESELLAEFVLQLFLGEQA